ncbi:uncharacterized protein GIQ15_00263 [Arthroderma uncinatum]|uniref:uncharacterized protein n=1 Tax=Arthroderma uncinatum TaxID=74035 RepID=UPI00144A7BD4|nr:uncharacterized protein GIQ15_00263 [Arthroderma uncinatum]KAF3490746.1 hypothetical protein GIQ15_00263 [Arthroderma uncinatum]
MATDTASRRDTGETRHRRDETQARRDTGRQYSVATTLCPAGRSPVPLHNVPLMCLGSEIIVSTWIIRRRQHTPTALPQSSTEYSRIFIRPDSRMDAGLAAEGIVGTQLNTDEDTEAAPPSDHSSHFNTHSIDDTTTIISVPLPSHRLASSALRALQVDLELSPLVKRTFRLASPHSSSIPTSQTEIQANPTAEGDKAGQTTTDTASEGSEQCLTVLETEYRATTNRMLRVAVNAFMDSLSVVVRVMEELDVDVLDAELGRSS